MHKSPKLRSSHLRRILLTSPRNENRHHLVGSLVICIWLEIVLFEKKMDI